MTASDEVAVRNRGRGLLLDSNLLLLLLVGSVEPELIVRFKRTRQFLMRDYELLLDFTSQFQVVVSTPHILCEVSHLAAALHGDHRATFFVRMGQMIERLDERNVAGRIIAADDYFQRLGITDTAIALLSTGDLLALTVDATLASCVAARGGAAVNFNHVRAAHW
jgi:hypothetical protein